MARIVVAGYLVRNPLGGYAWQAAHYLLGLAALGHEAWFYEDTGHYDLAYDPSTNAFERAYGFGIRATGAFLERLGFGARWVFADPWHGEEHGPAAGRADALLRDADLVINVAGVNRIPPERRGGKPALFVDIDPAFTQIRAAQGDAAVRQVLDEHAWHCTIGENIGTPRCRIPDAGYTWHPTRPPVAIEQWADTAAPCRGWTTIGRWDERSRDLVWNDVAYRWTKRAEWMRCLDLPRRTGADFEIAMDVENVPGDLPVLAAHGWRVDDPRVISGDPWTYRDWIRGSRGEFTVAKDLNVRLRSGWFSDRAACYLAAGRPVVEQDTAFGDVLPLGPGLHAFRTVAEAAEAIAVVEADYAAASRHAAAVAREYLDAARVVGDLLRVAGL